MPGKLESVNPKPNHSKDPEVELEASDIEIIEPESVELETKKAAEADKTRANLAQVRKELQAIKATRAEEAEARARIALRDAQKLGAKEEAEHEEVRQAIKSVIDEERSVDVDLSDIEEKPKGSGFSKLEEDFFRKGEEGVIEEAAASDEEALTNRLDYLKKASIPEFTPARHQEMAARRDELTDQINDITEQVGTAFERFWNALKLQRLRLELDKVTKAIDFSLERYAELRRDLTAAQRELALFSEEGDKLTDDERQEKRLQASIVKKLQAEIKPFEKAISRALNAR